MMMMMMAINMKMLKLLCYFEIEIWSLLNNFLV